MDRTKLLNIKELAELLKISRRSCYREVDAGLIPKPPKIGVSIRWRSGELDQWIADGAPTMRQFPGRAK